MDARIDAATIAAGLQEALGGRPEVTAGSPKRLWIRLAPTDLVAAARWLRDNVAGCRLATSTGIDQRDGVGLFHHFAINGTPLVVTLKLLLAKPEPHAPSLATTIAAAGWIEREIHDLLGVVFDGHPDARRLLKAESMAGELPLRRDFDPARFKERIGERSEF